MRIGDRYPLLAETRGAVSGPTPPNLRIIVADVDETLARAKARGWAIKLPLKDRGYGLRDFTVSDPMGSKCASRRLRSANPSACGSDR